MATLSWVNLWAPFFQQQLPILYLSVTFGYSHQISNFFIILLLLWWSVIRDLWCYYCKEIMTRWRLRWWLTFWGMYIVLFRQYYCTFHRLLCDVKIICTCAGKPKSSCGSLYCSTALLWWSGSTCLPELCLNWYILQHGWTLKHVKWKELVKNLTYCMIPFI